MRTIPASLRKEGGGVWVKSSYPPEPGAACPRQCLTPVDAKERARAYSPFRNIMKGREHVRFCARNTLGMADALTIRTMVHATAQIRAGTGGINYFESS
jgi:hypothetical protein